jgi:hypothetical protein
LLGVLAGLPYRNPPPTPDQSPARVPMPRRALGPNAGTMHPTSPSIAHCSGCQTHGRASTDRPRSQRCSVSPHVVPYACPSSCVGVPVAQLPAATPARPPPPPPSPESCPLPLCIWLSWAGLTRVHRPCAPQTCSALMGAPWCVVLGCFAGHHLMHAHTPVQPVSESPPHPPPPPPPSRPTLPHRPCCPWCHPHPLHSRGRGRRAPRVRSGI